MRSGASIGGHGVPAKIGPYRIESRLGVGGMGEVYRAYDERLKRPVAIKRILVDQARDAALRERFRREAQAAAGLSHPSIVQIHDIVETADGDWIVMELVEGRTLRRVLDDGPVALPRALRLGREIAEGLAEAHAQGVVHRDLKTENVMVVTGGHAKILDFGLAKQLAAKGEKDSGSGVGTVVGTHRAMSPEQAMGHAVDPRSDLFSLGSLLYEILTGAAPFSAPNPAQTLARVCTLQQPPVRQKRPEVPRQLSDLIDRLLEKEPADRPQTAAEVAAAFAHIASPAAAGTPVDLPAEVSRQGLTPSTGPSFPGRMEEVSSGSVLSSAGGLGGLPHESSQTAVRTLLVCDLVDSTSLVERLGDQDAARLFRRHDRLARDLLAAHGGLEIDKSDGFLLLFERPISAVSYALAYHRALQELAREEDVEMRARVGIYVGEVILQRNSQQDVVRGAKPLEVEGLAKPMVARLMSLALGRQTLISRSVFEMARRGAVGAGDAVEEAHWLRHGEYRFKGVEEPVEVFEVGIPELSPLEPPPDSAKARRIADAVAGDPRARLRRRVAAVLAVVALVSFAVGLSWRWQGRGASKIAGTRPSISVLGFKNLSGRPEAGWLSTAFSEMLRTELAVGETLRIVPGESVARMQLELELPDVATLAPDTLARVGRNLSTDYVVVGSYALLGSSEKRVVRLDYSLQATAVGETVASFSESGLEAALFEVVAQAGARLRAELGLRELSPAQAGAARALVSASPEATRLYSQALARLHSYDVPEARDLLQQAVAADPQYALAHAALSEAWLRLGHDAEAEESAAEALELAQGKELPREEVLWIEGRYHEASSRWLEAVETYEVLAGFYPDNVEYGLRLAEAQTAAGRARDALGVLDELRRLPESLRGDPRIDLAEGRARESLSEFRALVSAAERAMEKSREREAHILFADAALLAGNGFTRLGELERAAAAFAAGQRIFRQVGARSKEAEALVDQGVVLKIQGDISRAEGFLRQALEIHREVDNRKMIATSLLTLGNVVWDRGELATAKEMFAESLEIAREIGDPNRQALRLVNLGMVLEEEGDLPAAGVMARDAAAVAGASGDQRMVAWSIHLMGRIVFARGRLHEARERFEEAARLAESMGVKQLSGVALADLGALLLEMGEPEAAGRSFQEAESVQSELGEALQLARTRVAHAMLLLELGHPRRAEELARSAAEKLTAADQRDAALRAEAVIASTLIEQGRLAEAEGQLTETRRRARASQNPRVRGRVGLAAARLAAAAGDIEAARDELRGIVDEAAGLGLLGLELEARLALARTGLAAGERAAATAELEAIAGQAAAQGFSRIASAARGAAAEAR